MTNAPPTAAATSESKREPESASLTDREKAEETLLILGRLGATVHDALIDHVDAAFVGNAEVFVITSLHLRGPLRPSDIVAGIGMSSGGVTKLIGRLEAGGYVSREYGTITTDRRATRLTLTSKGTRLAHEYADALLSELGQVRDAVERLHALTD